ncbi:hypothetical protein ZIOFF_055751 [Zingiber officinale]|uniref:Uncharacterized protein n=1 Tax=Zingiber officinale TaxID=94328 RepID=A0A8J5FMC2_ZINOF|nr:hypothetical protein ZIOFF_055751 [Zingiber officinale]
MRTLARIVEEKADEDTSIKERIIGADRCRVDQAYGNPKKYTRESISPCRANEVKIESSIMSKLNAGSISSDIQGGVSDFENAKDFLDSVKEQFQSSSKALATTLIIKMVTSKYNDLGGVHGHILRLE